MYVWNPERTPVPKSGGERDEGGGGGVALLEFWFVPRAILRRPDKIRVTALALEQPPEIATETMLTLLFYETSTSSVTVAVRGGGGW